jgi:hypothetical protein
MTKIEVEMTKIEAFINQLNSDDIFSNRLIYKLSIILRGQSVNPEDIMQEVKEAILIVDKKQKWKKQPPENYDNFKKYFSAAAQRRAFNKLRNLEQKTQIFSLQDEGRIINIHDDTRTEGTRYDQRAILSKIQEWVASLPPEGVEKDDWEIFYEIASGDETIESTAENKNLTKDVVRGKIRKIKNKLISLLDISEPVFQEILNSKSLTTGKKRGRIPKQREDRT